MAKKLECNEDLVLDLMNYSPYGALGEAFIVEAIRTYAERFVATPLPPTQPNSFFSNETWNKVAIDVKARCEKFYGRHSEEQA